MVYLLELSTQIPFLFMFFCKHHAVVFFRLIIVPTFFTFHVRPKRFAWNNRLLFFFRSFTFSQKSISEKSNYFLLQFVVSLENSVVRHPNKMNNMNLWWIIAVIHIDFLKALGFLKVLARSDPSRPRSLAIIYTGSIWSKSIIHITLAFEKFKPKMFRPERDSNPWPQRYRCSALPTELWNHLVLTFRVRNMPHALEIRSWNYIDMKSLESPMSRLIAECCLVFNLVPTR